LRDRALFDLAIGRKRRSCDLVTIKIGAVISGGSIRNRSTVIQQKNGNTVRYFGVDIDDALTLSEQPKFEFLPAPQCRRGAGEVT
jgi:hypothetical protein